MERLEIRGDTPDMDPDDGLEVMTISHPFRFAHLDDAELVDAIITAVNAMSGAGNCAEDDYQQALAVLRRRTKKACDAIAREYDAMDEGAYLDRWSLVMLLAELGHRDTCRVFARILEARIPEERSADPHSSTTVGEEVMIRTTAVEGLERLAHDGQQDAVEVLLANVNHEHFSVRRACVQALVAVGGDEMRVRLAEVLPSRHKDLLTIKRRDVREVDQATGGLFLKARDNDGTPAPDDECDPRSGGDHHDGHNTDPGRC